MPATFVTQNNLKNIDIDYEFDKDPIFKTSNGKQRFGIKYCMFFLKFYYKVMAFVNQKYILKQIPSAPIRFSWVMTLNIALETNF